ncbi:hypothetical protein C1H46_020502, partial [Malus baccata]
QDNAGLIPEPAVKKLATAFIKLGNISLVNDVLTAVDASGCKIDQKNDESVMVTFFASMGESSNPALLVANPTAFPQVRGLGDYFSLPEKDMLFQMLRWMPGQGYVADSATRNPISNSSHLFGRQQIAEMLSKQHMILKASKSREKDKRV